ncbi:MAG: ribonuclease III [Spirulinaceae cyanobacterium SM2_1_0]|nr:ribonuclease III [Spirulinaceae cyanobacterium SM2_1_0]
MPATVTLPDARRQKQLAILVQRLGLPATLPVDYHLLDCALIHSSFSPTENYEQLEFVGDAVVRLLASEVLLATYPTAAVGEFAAIRSVLVSDRVLADFGDHFGLDRYLLVSAAAANDHQGWRSRLADAFEAVLGALYLSQPAMTQLRPWLSPLLRDKAAEIRRDPTLHNYKEALQAWTQGQFKVLPEYRVRESGAGYGSPERFEAEVWLHQELLGRGRGRSKKAAEQAAAKTAFVARVQLDHPQDG